MRNNGLSGFACCIFASRIVGCTTVSTHEKSSFFCECIIDTPSGFNLLYSVLNWSSTPYAVKRKIPIATHKPSAGTAHFSHENLFHLVAQIIAYVSISMLSNSFDKSRKVSILTPFFPNLIVNQILV